MKEAKKIERHPTPEPSNDDAEKRHAKRGESFGAKYLRFVPLAKEHAKGELKRSTVDPVRAVANLRTGLASLKPHEAELRRDPTVAWDEVFELVDLGEAYIYACDRVTSRPATREQIDAKRDELQKLRVPALLFARGLAVMEPDEGERRPWTLEHVEEIEAGNGLVDMARDAITLAADFRGAAELIRNKHPFTETHLAKMESLGEWMLRNVTPDGARVAPQGSTEAENIRDGLWAEIVRRHPAARAAGFKLFGEDFGQYVPPLGSRVATRGAKDDDADPTPEPPNHDTTPR